MMPKAEFDQILANTERVSRIVIGLTAGLIMLLVGSLAFGATYGLQDQAGNRLTLHDDPCTVAFLKGWKRASFRYEGKDLKACWMASNGLVYVVDESGDLTPVPTAAFTKMQEG